MARTVMYDNVTILEDDWRPAHTFPKRSCVSAAPHRIDLLLLVHGKEGKLVGYRGQKMIGHETFDLLLDARRADPASVDLRMVFGLNCYGASLMERWHQLGATVVNGTPGVNWLPEPSLSVFLRNWLRGSHTQLPCSAATHTHGAGATASGAMRGRGKEHPKIESSRQVVYGDKDVTIHSRA